MDILISGGGIAGLTLAYRLHRLGHRPVVAEKVASLRGEGYMMDFFGPGYDVSEKMGLLPDLEKIHYQIPRLAFVDSNGNEKFSVDYAAVRKLFNGRHFNFMRGDLERVLYSRVKDDVEVRFATTVGAFDQDAQRVQVRFRDGTTDSFDLLVGADGVHSHVRALAFGPEPNFMRFLGYDTAAFILDQPPQALHDRAAFYTLTEPRRQAAIYPIRGNRLATFFVHKSARPPGDFCVESARQELHAAYRGMGWIVPELLERSEQVAGLYFDAVTQIEMPTWSLGRVVLVGDACQCVSLIAGQGASMAMAGAYILAQALAEARDDVAGALARYEQQIKPDIEEKQRAGRSMARWFVPEDRAHLAVRDLFLRATGWPLASRFLRNQFALGGGVKI